MATSNHGSVHATEGLIILYSEYILSEAGCTWLCESYRQFPRIGTDVLILVVGPVSHQSEVTGLLYDIMTALVTQFYIFPYTF